MEQVFKVTIKDTIDVSAETIANFEHRLGLEYVSKNETEGMVCYANSAGLRDEFRQSFTFTDLQDYIMAVLKTKNMMHAGNTITVPYPEDVESFWEKVQKGSATRNRKNKLT